ncbi:error-prone DNA polymerase [Oceanibacterium hippocampi]|uniref:Error-prone DNA polymerase n=1 Tax=Oceanibacterium hippocampi TaxID=745714 RepID=A0A1Y5SET6_9PROT|nr:error-prone DNA polymerase [Oceanibacterium hippocampi]SLN39007.1 Error-prone DNA polymerase [Oceanibacterium hippocampi]
MSAYAELEIASNFSFLHGASHAWEYAGRAKMLGLTAFAVTDRNSLAGVVRAHVAAKEAGIRFVVGARLDFRDGRSLLCYPTDRAAYGRLSRLITLGRRRAPKGECHLDVADFLDHGEGQIAIALAERADEPGLADWLVRLRDGLGPGALHLALHHLCRGDDERRIAGLVALAGRLEIPVVACNAVHAHAPERKRLQDVLVCIREGVTIDAAGHRLFANGERHLKGPAEMAALFARWPEALAAGLRIVEACRFSLDELAYEYPKELSSSGRSPQEELEHLTRAGAAKRYPDGVPEKVRTALGHELDLIGSLGYAPYFLTVEDIVRFARGRGILCQGRGSAANSAVCYCLGITAVDPARADLLFERFVSAARREPPDIDVDFEHERREEVIQYIYAKYGRERAGLAATVISYRPKMAIREVGKALGLSEDVVAVLARTVWGRHRDGLQRDQIREAGLDPEEPRLALVLELAETLLGFPRHLSQHVGGFVITEGPLCELVPIENAAMADRTVVEWDKDDLDALGILKIDVLALGMLTCIRKAFALLASHYGKRYTLAGVPPEVPAVYDMLCRADSVGVFQVESRAQMSMLPRLKPRTFYDLVIEVAIVRPGPIQGDMVHPYLRRRSGEEAVEFPSEDLRQVLGKTLGVPLFQEQAMRIAIVAAGFTPAEADQLRRAMATFRRNGTIHSFREKMIDGMTARGYEAEFAERCFSQIEGFGEYGFPESHAASFALLVYVSAWLKHVYPAVFACALLNSQPMGFYAPAQIVRDAREHGVVVRPVDVNRSDWDATLERTVGAPDGIALRLGFREVKGFRAAAAEALVAARGDGYDTVHALWRRSGLGPAELERLAEADAFGSLGLGRREARWAIRGLGETPLPLFAAAEARERAGHNGAPVALLPEPVVRLPDMPVGEAVIEDYASLRMSLRAHPMELLRSQMRAVDVVPAATLKDMKDGMPVRVAGLVLVRQRPGTAQGVIFATLEDETGIANIIVWPTIFERFRRTVLTSRLLCVQGIVQKEGLVIHVIARRLVDYGEYLATLRHREAAATMPKGRNFH